ncbi:NAD(P)-dependent oxidoreductase [Sphingomonas sp. HMP6]|uniref:NAD(P)-dependent oxidoreductase n=1 Tax=Sphingomonas sp. HMP6 TaxID=1517551 RepID=UPI0015966DF5|nr:NAD(P)-dependent oxidoreductase [Sphingomonas sp. HMP6]BCA60708.1 dehydrogenase [Sphingomonas sp. HMP6]
MKAVLPAFVRGLIEAHLPDDLEIAWVTTREEATAAMVDADIGWVDLFPHGLTPEAVAAATSLKWLFTAIAGIDSLDMAKLTRDGTIVTNGSGINAVAVAEYAVMSVLVAAKRYDEVVRIADRRAWPDYAPGRIELFETSALIVGYGAIGRLIGERLAAFGVAVTGVTRSGRDGTLTPDAWKAKLGAFDWVILAAPSTDATQAMIGERELAAMKPGAWLFNLGRGDMVDQDALIAALTAQRIGGACLDTVTPEPLPPEDPLWAAPNLIHTMHLSGRSQTKMFQRAAALFLRNLDAFRDGRPMENVVDLTAGY